MAIAHSCPQTHVISPEAGYQPGLDSGTFVPLMM
jgi:hypothetical protein